MAGGMRASGPKADLALVVADGDAAAAGVFTTNIVCAAPVTFCRNVLAKRETVRAVRARVQRPLKQRAWLHAAAGYSLTRLTTTA